MHANGIIRAGQAPSLDAAIAAWASQAPLRCSPLRASVRRHRRRHSQGTQGIDTEHSETGSRQKRTRTVVNPV